MRTVLARAIFSSSGDPIFNAVIYGQSTLMDARRAKIYKKISKNAYVLLFNGPTDNICAMQSALGYHINYTQCKDTQTTS